MRGLWKQAFRRRLRRLDGNQYVRVVDDASFAHADNLPCSGAHQVVNFEIVADRTRRVSCTKNVGNDRSK
jgi:hypothetical protein